MTMLSGCWMGAASGMACADDARATAKATATSLIIFFSIDAKRSGEADALRRRSES
jgi:hypothetical protein